MEKVQFQLEATLPELKDLHEKGLFSKNEINEITKRRTALETSLIRQKTRKEDFFKYAEYEINLERLRKVRWKRLGYNENPPPPSPSTYSIPRRVMYILKRATSKFPGDLAVWLAYVEFAAREGMRKSVMSGLTNALQHHPLSSTLYLLLSYHHLHPNDPFPREAIPSSSTLNLPAAKEPSSSFSLEGTSTARTTLLLGLRALPTSEQLWTEYIKLELGWVEALRRRWSALGLESSQKGKEPSTAEEAISLDGGEGSFGPEGESARKAILAGQLVVQALKSALEAIKADDEGLNYREQLLKMLRSYPSPLRSTALEVLHEDLAETTTQAGSVGARAKLLIMIKAVYERPYDPARVDDGDLVLEGVELIDELGRISKEIRKEAKRGDSSWSEIAGSWLCALCKNETLDMDARRFLYSTLTSLTSPKSKPSAKLLLLHLSVAPDFTTPDELAKVAQSHVTQYPSNPVLQHLYVSSLSQLGDFDRTSKACEVAVKALGAAIRTVMDTPDEEHVKAIWLLWANATAGNLDPAARQTSWEKLLRAAQKSDKSLDLFPSLLSRYFITSLEETDTAPYRLFSDLVARYHPNASFYSLTFDTLVSTAGPALSSAGLKKVYESWKATCKSSEERLQAASQWTQSLLEVGKAHEARLAAETVKRELSAEDAVTFEQRWQAMLDRKSRPAGNEDEDEDVEMSQSDESDEA